MQKISTSRITSAIEKLCIDVNTNLREDIVDALNKALKNETSKTGREILRQLIQNAQIAHKEKLPLCQDTGLAIIFLEIGQQVQITDGVLEEAINEGASRGYHHGYLRKSVVSDPLNRKNTNDNTPAIVHTKIVPGDKIKIQLMAKGGGSENCSTLRMFTPSASIQEINDFVLETINKAGPNACPPIIVGIGIGGNFEYAPLLAKKALLRNVNHRHSQTDSAKWEKDLLQKINATGIGPMGLGGKTTALAVHIEKYPCHISSLPVAINIECHAHRWGSTII